MSIFRAVDAATPEMEKLAKEFSDRAYESAGGSNIIALTVLVWSMCNVFNRITKEDGGPVIDAALTMMARYVSIVLAGKWVEKGKE